MHLSEAARMLVCLPIVVMWDIGSLVEDGNMTDLGIYMAYAPFINKWVALHRQLIYIPRTARQFRLYRELST
ncbi:hypothetical protein GGS21DRAFT_292265 [Xylaria nigripes]|nr:hypothetical protein GGS21DRAFT_292265 [Xylaria nigripes]